MRRLRARFPCPVEPGRISRRTLGAPRQRRQTAIRWPPRRCSRCGSRASRVQQAQLRGRRPPGGCVSSGAGADRGSRWCRYRLLQGRAPTLEERVKPLSRARSQNPRGNGTIARQAGRSSSLRIEGSRHRPYRPLTARGEVIAGHRDPELQRRQGQARVSAPGRARQRIRPDPAPGSTRSSPCCQVDQRARRVKRQAARIGNPRVAAERPGEFTLRPETEDRAVAVAVGCAGTGDQDHLRTGHGAMECDLLALGPVVATMSFTAAW